MRWYRVVDFISGENHCRITFIEAFDGPEAIRKVTGHGHHGDGMLIRAYRATTAEQWAINRKSEVTASITFSS